MNSYPPVSFYFKLSFTGLMGLFETSFKEISGISMEMGVEEIAEGGVNGYKHRVPTTAKFSNLVLKRGLIPMGSELDLWCSSIINGGLEEFIETKIITVFLLDASGLPVRSWVFHNAWPVKWSISDFNSMNNEIVIETLEFTYNNFQSI
jgi:phage tail-like protein